MINNTPDHTPIVNNVDLPAELDGGSNDRATWENSGRVASPTGSGSSSGSTNTVTNTVTDAVALEQDISDAE